MDDKITLEDVRRLDVQPGETLLVTIPAARFTDEQIEQVRECFLAAFPKSQVVIATDEIAVEVVAEATDA